MSKFGTPKTQETPEKDDTSDAATDEIISDCSDDIKNVGVENIPGIQKKIAYLPIGPTQEHIDNLVRRGKISNNQIYIGDEACSEVEINVDVPQVFGYVIKNDIELESIIMDKEVLENIKDEIKKGGEYPTIYLMNDNARVEYIQYLGGRMPSVKEQFQIWKDLPGDNNREKATNAGIPFSGGFSHLTKKFYNVGDDVVLGSSTSQGISHERVCLGMRQNCDDRYDPFDIKCEGGSSIQDAGGVHTFVIFDNQPSTKHHDGVNRI